MPGEFAGKVTEMKATKFQNHCPLLDTVNIDILTAYTYINFTYTLFKF